MQIGWLILATEYRRGKDGSDSIIGILRGVRLPGPPYNLEVALIARTVLEVSDVGPGKTLEVSIYHEDGLHEYTEGFQLRDIPMQTFLAKLPIWYAKLVCEFTREGLYSFTISIDGELKAQEWLNIIQEEE